MTIKEMEARSGMTRANIRFYEAEGLLDPERSANGYRNYSEEDLDALLRVKLLRSLRMPLEEVKRIHDGKCSLRAAMNSHITALDAEAESIANSRRVCREIAEHRDEYCTLDAKRYLDSLASPAVPVPETDALPPVYAPWRRWFARWFDQMLCSMCWTLFLLLVCNINVTQRGGLAGLLDNAAGIVLMVITEPVLLHFFGTTPGKWLLGLSVTDPEGGRLTLSAARERTWGVLWRGMGLSLPGYGLIREWKSYNAYAAGEPLPWEDASVICLRDDKRWRYGAYAAATAVTMGMLALGLSVAETPRYGQDMTAAEFSASFNRFAEYYGIDFGAELDEKGRWVEDPPESGVYVIHLGGETKRPDFVFTEEDGVVTGVSFRYEASGPDVWPLSCQDQMMLAALSFACAQEGFGYFSAARAELLRTIADNEYRSFDFAQHGVSVRCEVDSTGYQHAGFLWPEKGVDNRYALSFTVTKEWH